MKPEGLCEPVFSSEAERRAARAVMDAIAEMETRHQDVPNSAALKRPEIQQALLEQVEERLAPVQGALFEPGAVELASVVARTTEIVTANIIDIPRIAVVPTGEVAVGFHPFALDLNGLHLQPAERALVIHHLQSNAQETLSSEAGIVERRLEDYIVHSLVDYDDIDYDTHADLLYDLAGQFVRHLLGYLSEDEARVVLDRDRRLIAKHIHAQMMQHHWEKATGYEVKVSRGFTQLKPSSYTAFAGQPIRSLRETLEDKGRIKQLLFGGFRKCLYPLVKFDSDSERRFAQILERDADKWLRPVKGQFQIYYRLGAEHPEYVPDFVIEATNKLYLAETKARGDMEDAEVLVKAEAAVEWCRHATGHAVAHGGKPWRFLLIPHDEIEESRRLEDFERFALR